MAQILFCLVHCNYSAITAELELDPSAIVVLAYSAGGWVRSEVVGVDEVFEVMLSQLMHLACQNNLHISA